MDHGIFTEVSYIIAVAAIVALVMRVVKQPLIIGHILTGIIVGPFVLDIVHDEETIESLATVGISLLLFIIGLGLNPKVIKELGKVVAIAGIGQVLITTLLALGIALSPLLGLELQEAFILAVALSFSSTVIILKLISDKKEQSRLYGKLTIGLLLVQDIAATIALVVVAANSEGGFSISDLGLLLMRGSIIGLVLMFASTKVLPRMQKIIAGSQEFLFLFALGWGFSVATMFDKAGFSLEVGALFAGVALAPLAYAQEVAAKLKPLRDFFIILFFVSLGAGIALDTIGAAILPAIIFSALIIIFNPIIISTLLGLFGYTKRTSFKAGIAMAQISEFSLVLLLLAERNGFVQESTVAIATVTGLITIFISSYMIIYTDRIYAWFEARFKMFEHKKIDYEQRGAGDFQLVLFGFQRGGHEFAKVFKAIGKKFIVIDYDPEMIDQLEKGKYNYLYGDATDVELLDEIGIEQAKLVVSTITDHETNKFLATHLSAQNSNAVIILHAENSQEASDLYNHGATYVMMPHYIGSEKIGSFIKRNGLKKTEFKKAREKHLSYLEAHLADELK